MPPTRSIEESWTSKNPDLNRGREPRNGFGVRGQSVSGDTALPRRVASRFERRLFVEPRRPVESAVALRFPAHSKGYG